MPPLQNLYLRTLCGRAVVCQDEAVIAILKEVFQNLAITARLAVFLIALAMRA